MKAIETKYLGCTNIKPSRIRATDGDGHSKTFSVEELTESKCLPSGYGERSHRVAAEKFRDLMGWHGELAGGWLRNVGVWVFIS